MRLRPPVQIQCPGRNLGSCRLTYVDIARSFNKEQDEQLHSTMVLPESRCAP